MSEEQFRTVLRALATEVDESVAGCDEIDAQLDAILARSAEPEGV